MRASLCMVALLGSCSGGSDGPDVVPCTPEGLELAGASAPKAFDEVLVLSMFGECQRRLLTSQADVADAFPNDTAPEQLKTADFAVDRVVLGSSNPAVQFAVEQNGSLVVGEERFCQGAAPSCVAYIVRGTTLATLSVLACQYAGPDPCTAP